MATVLKFSTCGYGLADEYVHEFSVEELTKMIFETSKDSPGTIINLIDELIKELKKTHDSELLQVLLTNKTRLHERT